MELRERKVGRLLGQKMRRRIFVLSSDLDHILLVWFLEHFCCGCGICGKKGVLYEHVIPCTLMEILTIITSLSLIVMCTLPKLLLTALLLLLYSIIIALFDYYYADPTFPYSLFCGTYRELSPVQMTKSTLSLQLSFSHSNV